MEVLGFFVFFFTGSEQITRTIMCLKGFDNIGVANLLHLFPCTDIQWKTLATVANAFFF